jgi:hypothetical protein
MGGAAPGFSGWRDAPSRDLWLAAALFLGALLERLLPVAGVRGALLLGLLPLLLPVLLFVLLVGGFCFGIGRTGCYERGDEGSR